MRVSYTRRAFADRQAIFDYLDQRDPRAARNFKALSHTAEAPDFAVRERIGAVLVWKLVRLSQIPC